MLKKIINISGKKVTYSLRLSRRARSSRLTLYQTGEVVVTIPRRLSESYAEKFIIEKSDWLLSKIGELETVPPLLPNAVFGESEKIAALELANKKLGIFNARYNLTFNKVIIRDQKTVWGSCSRRRTLSFNFRILFLPDDLVDYLIVHELCHLAEMNHSRRFWDSVATAIPDYISKRKRLRNIRSPLFFIGGFN